MKLTLLLTIALSLQVSASALAQRIDLQVENEKLENVLKEMRKQSGYAFIYSSEYLRYAQPVTLHVKDRDIEETLFLLFEDQPFTYTIKEKIITIVPKKESSGSNVIQQNTIRGKVTDSLNNPLQGVTVIATGTSNRTMTDRDGLYELTGVPQDASLLFRLLSYEILEVPADRPVINVILKIIYRQISEVDISINTGYQILPKERATGSFVYIDNDLLNRRVSTNIMDRLEGIAGSVLFPNRNIPVGSNESSISIRGRSTIFANASPLIVIDNFPYNGDLNSINPNDIESISLLKDAAAASIWGTNSGNGVIIITTKQGNSDQPLKIEVQSNVTIGEKPDLFRSPSFLKASDFIDVEKFLFERGFYDADINNTVSRPIVSPVIGILVQQRNGNIIPQDAELQIDMLRNIDYYCCPVKVVTRK